MRQFRFDVHFSSHNQLLLVNFPLGRTGKTGLPELESLVGFLSRTRVSWTHPRFPMLSNSLRTPIFLIATAVCDGGRPR